MRVAYFECTAGISGDMILGALLDAGLAEDALLGELGKVGLSEFELSVSRVQRQGIAGTRAHVKAQEGHVHRTLDDVVATIDGSSLSAGVKRDACRVFQRLAQAEAEVHGTTPQEVHFHEVGAVDAIVDIVGAVAGLSLMKVERVYGSRLRFGSGVARSSHGALPVPVPAVVALCRNVPAERTDLPFEMVTPTGAALLTTLAHGIGEPITLRTQQVGYGAGERDPDQVANLLRLEIGELGDVPEPGEKSGPRLGVEVDQVVVIETNIDDMNPEVYSHLTQQLLDAGARDAYLTPVLMKKGRPGILVTVLAETRNSHDLAELLMRETTTLGVRMRTAHRLMLPRETGTVDTPFGPVRVKTARLDDRTRVMPEYEDCARIAREQAVPVLDVYQAAQQAPPR